MKHSITTTLAAMFIIAAASLTATAQCDSIVQVHSDKMTGKQTNVTDYIIVSKDGIDGIGLMFMSSDRSVTMSAQVFGASPCVDEKARMLILFTDGSRMTITNQGKFNCERRFSKFWFSRTDQQLQELKVKRIEAIRVETYKGSVTEDVPPAQAELIANTVKCISR